jgi:hypothetical protein
MPLKHERGLKRRVREHLTAINQASHFTLSIDFPILRSCPAIHSADAPSEVDHPIISRLHSLELGFRKRNSGSSGISFIRANLFEPSPFTTLPFDALQQKYQLN